MISLDGVPVKLPREDLSLYIALIVADLILKNVLAFHRAEFSVANTVPSLAHTNAVAALRALASRQLEVPHTAILAASSVKSRALKQYATS
eukprot:6197052-Pleurochrysis_carterae.AAC.2